MLCAAKNGFNMGAAKHGFNTDAARWQGQVHAINWDDRFVTELQRDLIGFRIFAFYPISKL